MDHMPGGGIAISGDDTGRTAELDLEIPAYLWTFRVTIQLKAGADTVSEKSRAILRDLANLTAEHRAHIRRLLHDHAMAARDEVSFSELVDQPPARRSGFLRRLFSAPPEPRYVALAQDDPRHPCFFRDGLESVELKLKWQGIEIDENDQATHRFAVLGCTPEWEEEHGVYVVIRDGVPVGTDHYPVDFEKFD